MIKQLDCLEQEGSDKSCDQDQFISFVVSRGQHCQSLKFTTFRRYSSNTRLLYV